MNGDHGLAYQMPMLLGTAPKPISPTFGKEKSCRTPDEGVGVCGNPVSTPDSDICVYHQELNDQCVISEALVNGLMTRDTICRKIRQWPLMSHSEMNQILIETARFRKAGFSVCPDLKYDSENNLGMEDLYTVNRKFRGSEYEEHREDAAITKDLSPGAYWNDYAEEAIHQLGRHFPFISELLIQFDGNLIAAGGAIFKALFPLRCRLEMYTTDIDIFFIDPDVERSDISDDAKSKKADNKLISAISFLVDSWLN